MIYGDILQRKNSVGGQAVMALLENAILETSKEFIKWSEEN